MSLKLDLEILCVLPALIWTNSLQMAVVYQKWLACQTKCTERRAMSLVQALPAIAVALIVTIAFMFALRPLAKRVGLVDRPGGRKLHLRDKQVNLCVGKGHAICTDCRLNLPIMHVPCG